jgi:hypothetical protein
MLASDWNTSQLVPLQTTGIWLEHQSIGPLAKNSSELLLEPLHQRCLYPVRIYGPLEISSGSQAHVTHRSRNLDCIKNSEHLTMSCIV